MLNVKSITAVILASGLGLGTASYLAYANNDDAVRVTTVSISRSAASSETVDSQSLGTYRPGAPPAEQPDLIAAVGSDGVQGYVRAVDVMPPPPSNPREAVEQTRRMIGPDGRVVIPLYAADGTTQIGTYVVYDSVTQDDPEDSH